MTKPIPSGYHSITPNFTFKNSEKAIEFYKKAFGGEVLDLLKSPDGKRTMHATMQIGDSIFMMGDEMSGSEGCPQSAETTGSCPISLYLYVPNVDETHKQAVAAGGIPTMPVMDMFWGDRVGQIRDPFGYYWMIGTHKQDLTQEQITKGAEAFFAQHAKK